LLVEAIANYVEGVGKPSYDFQVGKAS